MNTPIQQNTALQAPDTAEELSAVLDVARSLLDKKWVFTPTDERLSVAMAQAHGLPLIVTRLLAARGIGMDGVSGFMNPTLREQMPDPYVLRDMDRAAARIADAIEKGESVAVFGDYDVDGATSSALLKRFFNALGLPLAVYIPDRIKEGYGPNAAALQTLRDQGADLLVTVDCGITAYDAIAAGTAAGLDIVILDHHRAEPALPDAHAVVNPNRIDDNSGLGHMAAVGVTFLAIVAVNRLLRQRGFYNDKKPEPHILKWLDIVALGTVCDVVPLTGINRAFVAQGLKVMAMRQNPGLVALGDIAGVSSEAGTFHAGFVYGPRVNAGGRVGEAALGWRLLSTEDPLEARVLASKLHDYNTERKAIEDGVLAEALDMVAARGANDDHVIMVAGEGWHPGVIGIVAARLKEKYNRPACVIAFDDNGIGKASGRSAGSIDLGAAIIAAKQNDILIAGGGHKMAAGFTVARARFAELTDFVNAHVSAQMDGAVVQPELRVDHVLSVSSLAIEMAEKIASLGPYGAGHAEPRFVLSAVKIIKPTVVGEKHVSCFLQDTAGGGSVKAIAFRAMDTALGEALLKSGGTSLHLAGHVTINNWQGRQSVNFQIVDAAKIYG
jgi:single-stranded-DNA-specific exonuclease